ncbi:helix-hairpin-helix domain-containing protein [Nocardia sp. NPDC003482]
MARDDERVRERLGALENGRASRGGGWDQDEFDPGPDDRYDDEYVAEPRTPQWLSEPSGGVSVWHERLVPERFRGTRWDPGRRGVLVLAAIGVFALVLAAAAVQREKPVPHAVPPLPTVRVAASPSILAAETTVEATPTGVVPAAKPVEPTAGGRAGELVVSVVGMVERPGLLHLPSGARVADAVSAAIARDGADLSTLNLARRLGDGDQVVVGAHGTDSGAPRLGSAIIVAGQPAGPSSASPQAKVNLNTATEAELDTLPGIGPTTARAILTWRGEHGRFSSLDQLAEVPGIGPARSARILPLVTL